MDMCMDTYIWIRIYRYIKVYRDIYLYADIKDMYEDTYYIQTHINIERSKLYMYNLIGFVSSVNLD